MRYSARARLVGRARRVRVFGAVGRRRCEPILYVRYCALELRIEIDLAQVTRLHVTDIDIRLNADRVDVATIGRQVPRGRDLDRAAIRQRINRLHYALAEGSCADKYACARILYGARGDLRGTGGELVDQHSQRPRRDRDVLSVKRRERLGATVNRHDRSFGNKERGHVDGRIKVAAAIVAQIKNDALDALVVELLHRARELLT